MKSNVSDYLKLVEAVYLDASAKCIADVSDLRDLETIRSRVKYQGISFLTITLPIYCRDFERSLANGVIDSTSFRTFRKDGSIPSFLKGMISRIFNRETGRIFEKEDQDFSTIIESIRQICLFFKKVKIDCTPKRIAAALDSFVEIERSLELFSMPKEDADQFDHVCSVLWDDIMRSIKLAKCRPRHGPGNTAERISGNQKYNWQRWHERLEPYFPIIETAYPLGLPFDSKELNQLTLVPEELEQPVRVITVPKTLKSPRIIAIEPCCMQYTQQAIQGVLVNALESSKLTTGHVNFTDQSINQELAIEASSTGQLATIDLSDASDRVPHDLAMRMFQGNPDLRDAIEACRSTRARLPNGTILSPLLKFASMGSSLCFPVEAMYFYTICVMALLRDHNLPVTRRNCFKVSRRVYVYGDDIIVPTTNAMTVLEYLQKYNCKVNTNKTFVSGSFRESCGVDAYRGREVTPLYLGKLRPENRQQADRLISWVKSANAFYKKGYWRTTTILFKQVERVLGPLPYVSETSGGLGRISFLGYRTINRWNRRLQRFEVKTWIPRPVYRTDILENYAALSKCLLKLEDLKNLPVSRDALHLEHSALHQAVALQLGWLPAQ